MVMVQALIPGSLRSVSCCGMGLSRSRRCPGSRDGVTHEVPAGSEGSGSVAVWAEPDEVVQGVHATEAPREVAVDLDADHHEVAPGHARLAA